MKNFDEDRPNVESLTDDDRAFVLRGERFTAKRGVHPDVLVLYDTITKDTPLDQDLKTIDALFIELVEATNDAADRYTAVRKQKDDPVSLQELLGITKWLLEVASGRPTGRSDDSSPGLKSTETASTDASSSTATQEASGG